MVSFTTCAPPTLATDFHYPAPVCPLWYQRPRRRGSTRFFSFFASFCTYAFSLPLFLAVSHSLIHSRKRPPRHKRTCRTSCVKQSSVSGSLVLSNMIVPDRHRFCPVHRCQIGAFGMPGNCCHHGPAKHGATDQLDFFISRRWCRRTPPFTEYTGRELTS